MFTAVNTKRVFTVLVSLSAILLLIPMAQAASKDRGARSSDSGRSTPAVTSQAQENSAPARGPQRDVRAASDAPKMNQAQRPQAEGRSDARAAQSNVRASGKGNSRSVQVERSIERPASAVAPQQSVVSRPSTNYSIDARPVPQSRREVVAAPVTRSMEKAPARGEQPQVAAPAGKTEKAARATSNEEKKRTVAAPVTRSAEKAAARSEQAQIAAPAIKTQAAVRTTSNEERKRIATPITRSVEASQTTAQPQTAATLTGRNTKADNPITNTQKTDKVKPADRSAISKQIGGQTKFDRKDTATAVTRQPTSDAVKRDERTQRLEPTKPSSVMTQPVTQKQDTARTAASTTQLRTERPAVQQAAPKQTFAQSGAERIARERTDRREKIVRGTAGREVAVPSTGKFMNVDRAVRAVDYDRTRNGGRGDRTIIQNNTVVNNYGPRRDARGGYDGRWWSNRNDGHDGGWWNRNYHHDNDHHSNFFLSLSFTSGYSYCSWAPIVYEPVYTPIWDPVIAYEPAVCTTVAYTSGPVWSSGYRTIVYSHGPYYRYSYVYPGYHRSYMFVSLGGYWPYYPYARYYWYGYHPWYWYGAEPVAYSAGGDTYNYYTYNYPAESSSGALTPGSVVNGVEVPDYDALRAVGQNVNVPAQLPPPEQPAPATESDQLFDSAVKSFGEGNYAAAIENFQRAVRLEPNDVILPFAYAQALFANNEYEQAAAVLNTALSAMAPAKPEVFFPRGLYKDDAVLTAQIRNLERAVMMNPTDPELQLLYGYQLLGIGKVDEAKVPLTVAMRDGRTAAPATLLLNLLERIKQEGTK